MHVCRLKGVFVAVRIYTYILQFGQGSSLRTSSCLCLPAYHCVSL